jgi:hypothetical protein
MRALEADELRSPKPRNNAAYTFNNPRHILPLRVRFSAFKRRNTPALPHDLPLLLAESRVLIAESGFQK